MNESIFTIEMLLNVLILRAQGRIKDYGYKLSAMARNGWKSLVEFYILPFIILHFRTYCDVYTVYSQYTGYYKRVACINFYYLNGGSKF